MCRSTISVQSGSELTAAAQPIVASKAREKGDAEEVDAAPPWRAVGILITVNLVEPIVMAMLFPVAPYMVADWVSADEVGTWAGLLTSAYNAASIPAGVFWGRLSDRVGRRPIMIILLCGAAVSTVLFGLSTSLAHAMSARCIGGLFSGVGGLVMAGIRDVTTPAQRSISVGYISWAYGAGFLLGPLIGAYLSNPADSLPLLRGTVLDRFPYLLPCLAVAMIIVLSGSLLFCLPTEPPPTPTAVTTSSTTPSTTSLPASPSVTTDNATITQPGKLDGTEAAGRIEGVEAAVEEQCVADESDGRQLLAGTGACSSSGDVGVVAAPTVYAQVAACAACRRLVAQPIILLLLAYLCLNFGAFGLNETYPLYAARNDSSGLGLAPQELAATVLPQAVTVMIMPLLYPPLSRRCGDKGAAYVGISSVTIVALMLPTLRWLPSHSSVRWVGLAALSSLRGTAGPLMFPAMMLLMNSVIAARVGFWNGLAQSVGACARAVAPALFGSLFAAGVAEGHRPFPLDVSMPFAITVLVLGAAVLLIASARDDHSSSSPSKRRRARSPWTRLRLWRAIRRGGTAAGG